MTYSRSMEEFIYNMSRFPSNPMIDFIYKLKQLNEMKQQYNEMKQRYSEMEQQHNEMKSGIKRLYNYKINNYTPTPWMIYYKRLKIKL